MPDNGGLKRAGLFFAVGPLRTGSSLMARCIDDHPAAICLCESEINRALFKDHYLELHCERMVNHGLTLEETIRYLDRKKPNDITSWLNWYSDVAPRFTKLYGKHYVPAFGEKSPDFFESPELVEHLASSYPLIYTVRDPRAVLRSIEIQGDASPEDKAERWDTFRITSWKTTLTDEQLNLVYSNQTIVEFMQRFGYER
jgi:hypothetical protein